MDDLWKEFEDLLDQGVEGLLDMIRVIEGREDTGDIQVKTRRRYSNESSQDSAPADSSRVYTD